MISIKQKLLLDCKYNNFPNLFSAKLTGLLHLRARDISIFKIQLRPARLYYTRKLEGTNCNSVVIDGKLTGDRSNTGGGIQLI